MPQGSTRAANPGARRLASMNSDFRGAPNRDGSAILGVSPAHLTRGVEPTFSGVHTLTLGDVPALQDCPRPARPRLALQSPPSVLRGRIPELRQRGRAGPLGGSRRGKHAGGPARHCGSSRRPSPSRHLRPPLHAAGTWLETSYSTCLRKRPFFSGMSSTCTASLASSSCSVSDNSSGFPGGICIRLESGALGSLTWGAGGESAGDKVSAAAQAGRPPLGRRLLAQHVDSSHVTRPNPVLAPVTLIHSGWGVHSGPRPPLINHHTVNQQTRPHV